MPLTIYFAGAISGGRGDVAHFGRSADGRRLSKYRGGWDTYGDDHDNQSGKLRNAMRQQRTSISSTAASPEDGQAQSASA